MCVIIKDSCWVVHIPFVHLVKFKFLAHFPVDHLAHPVESSLLLLLCEFAAFAYYVIDRFVLFYSWQFSYTISNCLIDRSSQIFKASKTILRVLRSGWWMISNLPLISSSASLFSRFFGDCSKGSNYKWYQHQAPKLFSVLWHDLGHRLVFRLPLEFYFRLERPISRVDKFIFFLINTRSAFQIEIG